MGLQNRGSAFWDVVLEKWSHSLVGRARITLGSKGFDGVSIDNVSALVALFGELGDEGVSSH